MRDKLRKFFSGMKEQRNRIEDVKSVDFRSLSIPFISKGSLDSAADASVFGGTVEKYQFWRPHMCAVCCLKMVGDATHRTNDFSLNELVDTCVAEGVFKVQGNDVHGAFHHPLAHVLGTLGLPARVAGGLTIEAIDSEIRQGKVLFLSVDLSKLKDSPYRESHLVVVYGVSSDGTIFHVHDCASVLAAGGNAMSLEREELERLSNGKGLVIG